jgi:peptidoglycan/LPS O-acetylase OafA/YrhL
MYIFHMPLHQLVGKAWLIARFGKLPPLPVVFTYGLVVFLVSYLAAFCSYHALEKQFLKLKRFFDGR